MSVQLALHLVGVPNVGAEPATLETLDEAHPEFVDAAPRCGDASPLVGTSGWHAAWGRRSGFTLLLPEGFEETPLYDGDRYRDRWTDGQRALDLVADYELDASDRYDRCLITLGRTDVLLVHVGRPAGTDVVIWPFAPRDAEGWRPATSAFVGHGWSPEDEGVPLTIVATMLGRPYPLRVRGAAISGARLRMRLRLDVVAAPVETRNAVDRFTGVIVARIENVGTHPVTLVRPGHGSETGQRMPTVRFEVRRDGRDWPSPPLRWISVPAVTDSDLFELRAGEGIILEPLLGRPKLTEPGNYRIRLHYSNDPSRFSDSTPTGSCEATPGVVRASTACKLTSNWVQFALR